MDSCPCPPFIQHNSWHVFLSSIFPLSQPILYFWFLLFPSFSPISPSHFFFLVFVCLWLIFPTKEQKYFLAWGPPDDFNKPHWKLFWNLNLSVPGGKRSSKKRSTGLTSSWKETALFGYSWNKKPLLKDNTGVSNDSYWGNWGKIR